MRVNLDEIKKSSERSEGLTLQLLAFSRKQILEMQVIDLNQILERLENMLRRPIGENIELLIISSEPISKVKADSSQIEQVIINLAVNA